MNQNKARDFYSAYYEGDLDSGLKQAFERSLQQDAEIAAEYAQFVRIMEELKGFAQPVEVPEGLHLKIRERVDAHAIEVERKQRQGAWFFAWKPLAYGAAATVAIIAVIVSLASSPGSSNVSQAGVAVVADAAPQFVVEDGVLRLKAASVGKLNLAVTDTATDKTVFSAALNGQRIDAPLVNEAADPMLVSVTFSRGHAPVYVAVPGKRPSADDQSSGTVADLLKAVSAMYRTPVVYQGGGLDAAAQWEFESLDPLASLAAEAKELGLKAEVREGGLVWIVGS